MARRIGQQTGRWIAVVVLIATWLATLAAQAGDVSWGGYTLSPHLQKTPGTNVAAQPRPAEFNSDFAQDLLRKVYASWLPVIKPITAGAAVGDGAPLPSNTATRVELKAPECPGPLVPLSNLPPRPNWP